jgi:hypothetical protein
VNALGAGSQVRKEFMSAQAWAFLNTNVMCPKKPYVHRDNFVAGGLALGDYVKAICTCVLQLIKAKIPKFHPRLLWPGRLAYV